MSDELDKKILAYIEENPGCTNHDLCVHLGYKLRGHEYQTVYDHTRSLERFGFLTVMQEDTGSKTRHFTVVA